MASDERINNALSYVDIGKMQRIQYWNVQQAWTMVLFLLSYAMRQKHKTKRPSGC